MAWTKTNDGGFAYNEGSLNFTLRGSAFYDSNGDGVPDGVTFENGRPVFMGIKNLRDFHFDVPRGILTVNGDEYKLLELDGNIDNGEELSLMRKNIGFPQGNDRTNPAAYKKVADNQFTYNEGSLNYTLTGSAFHDNDNNGIPDGVQIIGPKPFFGADGTIFDTSTENFHFKVPSGSLMVNGERYKLADLDGNPDNGYELVVPEVQGNLGWTKIDGGFIYKRPADNNPEVMGGLKLFGKDLVDTTGKGEPDGVTIPTIIIGKMVDGKRITQIGINGLHGEVFLNHPEAIHSFGVKGDSNYNILITKDNGNLVETLFTDISPNSTVNINNDTVVIKTDGNGNYNFTGNGRFRLNNDFITMHGGERELKVKIKNGKIQSIDGFTSEDVVKVSKSGSIRINGQKVTLAANQDMDMYGKPARAGGGESSDIAESADTADYSENLTENQNDVENKSKDFDYKSSDDAENETADFTFSVKNLENNDAVTADLVQKFFGDDKQNRNLNGEFILEAKPLADDKAFVEDKTLDISAAEKIPVEVTPNNFAENITPAEPSQTADNVKESFLYAAASIDDFVKDLFGVELDPTQFAAPQIEVDGKEKARRDTAEMGDNFESKYIQNLKLEEILPAKNIGADFVLNEEFELNTPLADSSQCRNQKLIDFERQFKNHQ